VQDLGCFLSRVPLDQPENDDSAVPWIEFLDACMDDLFKLFQVFPAAIVRNFFHLFIFSGQVELPSPFAPFDLVQRKIYGDPGEIGANARFAPEFVERLVEADKGFLTNIVCFGAVPQHSDHCRCHLIFIFFNELLEGIFVPASGLFDQFLFAQFIFLEIGLF
jgi:hypothetical protein